MAESDDQIAPPHPSAPSARSDGGLKLVEDSIPLAFILNGCYQERLTCPNVFEPGMMASCVLDSIAQNNFSTRSRPFENRGLF